MLALTIGEAKTIAAAIVIGLLVVAALSAWMMKQITQKVIAVVILAALAALVWTQRAALDECADKVRAAGTSINDPSVDATCTFFGRDIEITAGRVST